MDFVLISVLAGSTIQAIQGMIRKTQTAAYHRKMLQFFLILDDFQQRIQLDGGANLIGSFSDPSGNYGRIPSRNRFNVEFYLESLIKKHVKNYQGFYDHEVQFMKTRHF